MKKWLAGVALLGSLGVEPAYAADDYVEDLGFGLLAAGANLGYVPVKLAYAIVGATVGGVAYLVTGADLDAASAVWSPALGGTYVLSSAMMRGDEPIQFAATGAGAPTSAPDEAWSEESLP